MAISIPDAIQEPAVPPAIPKTKESPVNSHPVHCERFDSDQAAVDYLIQQCRRSELRVIYDTFVRLEAQQPRYSKETLDALVAVVAEFIDRATPRWGQNPYVFELFGDYVERHYLNRVIRTAQGLWPDRREKQSGEGNRKLSRKPKSRETAFVIHWLHKNRGPILNFIILEYADTSAEVLFGWGRHVANLAQEAVFRSDDKELVAEFHRFFTVLQRSDVSKKMDTEDLIQKLNSLRKQNKTASRSGTRMKAVARSKRFRRGRK